MTNCVAGDLAFITRDTTRAPIGTVVKVNFRCNSLSQEQGRRVWDVEAPRGRFFYAADDDLCPLRGWEVPPGFRDELFDNKRIFSDGERK